MGLTVRRSLRSRLFKTKKSSITLSVTALVLALTAVLPILNFQGQNASALEAWQSGGWKQISAGSNFACGIAENNTVYCWGSNTYGQLGNGATSYYPVTTPVAVNTSGVLAGKTILSVVAGSQHACVIASDNQVYCWGNNQIGQLGNNSTQPSSVPVAVDTSGVLSGKTVLSIDSEGANVCVIASDNQAYCWGDSGWGQHGNNNSYNSTVPEAVDTSGVLAGKTLTSISAGYNHVCAIASDNQAYCWGAEVVEPTDGPTVVNYVPVAVDTSGVLAGKTILSITSGRDYNCAIASDNQVYCWGYNANGQLGNNATSNSPQPVAVDTNGVLNGKTIVAITAGASSVCAIASDSKTYCWGLGSLGQASQTNDYDSTSLVPLAVDATGVLASKNISSISGGDYYTCAISTQKQAYCWGINTSGQLGNGSNASMYTPQAVGYASPVVDSLNVTTVPASGSSYTVIISGSQFQEGAVVKFGDNEVDTSWQDSTTLEVTVPTDGVDVGTVDVTVTNPDGKSSTLSNAFTFSTPPPPAEVSSAAFAAANGRKFLTLQGVSFHQYGESLVPLIAGGLISLNHTVVPVCTEGIGLSAAQLIQYNVSAPGRVSDTPTCYQIVASDGQSYTFTSTSAVIWLENNFDTTAPGTVSVNGSAAFAFNQPSGGGDDDDGGEEGETTPISISAGNGALADGRTMSSRPTFSGKAPAGSTVEVTVRSDPIVCTTIADSNGDWECMLPSSLPAGRHSVTVVVTDNGIVSTFGPYEVLVDGENATVIPGAPNTGIRQLIEDVKVAERGRGYFIAALIGASVTFIASTSILFIKSRKQARQ